MFGNVSWLGRAASEALAFMVLVSVITSDVDAVMPQYEIAHVFLLGEKVNKINDNGDAVGYVMVNGNKQATYWGRSSWECQFLGDLGSGTSEARSINDNGIICGFSGLADGRYRGFFYDGQMHMIPSLWQHSSFSNNDYSYAYDINDNGTISGMVSSHNSVWGWNALVMIAQIASDHSGIDVAGPRGEYSPTWASGHYLCAINASGYAVGQCGPVHDAIWYDPNGSVKVKKLPNGGGHLAYDINDNLWIVSKHYSTSAVHLYRPTPDFLGWEVVYLHTLGMTSATAVNNHNVVVGGYHCFIDGVVYNIYDHIVNNEGWSQLSLHDINDQGVILAQGRSPSGESRSLLLFPVPMSDILHVAPTASGDGSGNNWANAMMLQDALQTARDRLRTSIEFTEIWLAAGTYRPDDGNSTAFRFRLPSGVKLYGGFAGHETRLEERNPAANVTLLAPASDDSKTIAAVINTNAAVLLDGLHIINQRSDDVSAYCLRADFGSVKLNNCTLSYSASGRYAAVIRADNSEIELAGTSLVQNQPTGALVRLMDSTLTVESGNSFSVGQFHLFNSLVKGQPLALSSDQSIIAETWPSGLGEPIADMYGGVITPAAFYEPNEINFYSVLHSLHLAGRTKTWVINPDALGAGTFTWTASRLDSDDSDESLAAGSFWADGEIEIHGPIFEINPDNPAHVTPVDTDGESLLLKASVGAFQLVEQEDNPNHFERLDVELIVTGGYLANNSELATRGRLTMSLWLGTACHDDTSDLADFSRPIIITGDTTLSMTIAPYSMNISQIQNTITGSGKIECQGASQLIVQNADLSGGPDAEISVYGRLNVRGTLANTRISIFDAPVMQGDDLFYHDAGGRLVVGPNAQIVNNRIYCEGDQFMVFESETPYLAGISGNDITLTFHQGKDAQHGMLAESRSIDVDCVPGGANPTAESGIFQAAKDLSVRFDEEPANNWLLERLELREGARLNLIDQILSSDGNLTDAVYVRNLVVHPMGILNLGYSKLYYETLWLADEEGIETECTEPITPGDHLFANGGRVINIPLLGYSLVVIHMDDQTLPMSKNEFGLRVSTRQKATTDTTGVGAVNLLMGHRGPDNGVMNMQTQRSMLSGSATSVAAKGTFAPTTSDEILVEFEYQFVDGYAEDAELIVYLSDSPALGERLREIARIRPPADPTRNGYGDLHEDRLAAFSGTFARQDLNFRAGSYIELELRGQDARVLVDNWDPQIRCSIVCGNFGAWPYSMATFHDYLLLLSEIGLVSPLASNKGCLDLRRDNIVDMEDVLAWELDGTTLCPAAASGLLGLMGGTAIKPANSGFDPNDVRLVLFGRKEGDGVSNIMPANSFYAIEPDGLSHLLQSAPAGGRLLTNREAELFQVRGKDGIFDVQTGVCVVAPAQFDDVKVAGVGNPITDAAFDPHDSDVLYVVPVLVNDAYKAAARLRLTGDGEYTIEQVYGGDPNSNPGQSITITDPNHTMSVLYEPDTQHVREIEVDAEGNVYALSSYSGNRNDWLLIYQANDPNNCDYINLTDAGIQSPSSMTVTSNGRLYLTPSVSRQDNASTVIYRIDIPAASPAFLRTIEIVDCPTPPIYPGYHGLVDGEKAAITSMTEDRAAGKLYAVGFTTPVFDPEVVWNPQTTPKKIFTTPFVVELDLATETPLVYPIFDAAPQRVALPISVAWKGTASGPHDPCEGADIDGSGIVDLGDLVILASQWLQTPGIPSADIMLLGNKDNFVDMLDFQILAEHWYKTGCLHD